MRFIVFLLAVGAALTAVVTLLIGMMAIFTDNPHDPAPAWGYALVVAAATAIALAVASALLIWIAPRFAARLLWLVATAGLAGMAVQGVIMFLVRNNPNAPDAYNILTAVVLSGAVPAVLAALAALLARRRGVSSDRRVPR